MEHALNERNVLKTLNGDGFFCGFVESMNDDRNLYLLIEYISGGELMTHLRSRLTLHLDAARFYLAEIALAIETMHALNIVYRDLKPENIMLDSTGHIKLIDFGFSKQLFDINKDRLST